MGAAAFKDYTVPFHIHVAFAAVVFLQSLKTVSGKETHEGYGHPAVHRWRVKLLSAEQKHPCQKVSDILMPFGWKYAEIIDPEMVFSVYPETPRTYRNILLVVSERVYRHIIKSVFACTEFRYIFADIENRAAILVAVYIFAFVHGCSPRDLKL